LNDLSSGHQHLAKSVWHLFFAFAQEMKKRSAIILFTGLLVFGGSVIVWIVAHRNAQREWPWKQLMNAVTLGAALSTHQRNHGSYPARLEDLVAGGTLNPQTFERLQFRTGPRADPEHWLYRIPDQLSDIAIVSPTAIFPWDGASGDTVTARADGSGELIPHAKSKQIPAWATK
jgi:hypothetical protein